MEVDSTEDEVTNQFPQLDSVTDPSDHHYFSKLQKKNVLVTTTKHIHQEWKILSKENNLPSTIFVQVYEDQIDLVRACIVGPQDTPYANGLFFFDIKFPDNYPIRPSAIYYHSCGLRINPNLYTNGLVCLSLLNTWFGKSSKESKQGFLSKVWGKLKKKQGLQKSAKYISK